MVTLKTKTAHSVPFGRGIVNTEVYLKISDFTIDENGVTPHGYYYIVQDEVPHELDKIVPSILFWDKVAMAETQLSEFTSNSLKDAIYQRVTEFAFAKLQQEGTANYGIEPSDWEVFVAPPTLPEEKGGTYPTGEVEQTQEGEAASQQEEPKNQVE